MSSGARTLEEAVKMAQLAVDDGSNRVIIDRTQAASRKRGRLSAVSVGGSELPSVRGGSAVDEETENSEAMYWQEKFQKLQTETESMSSQKQELESSRANVAKLEERIKQLEKKVKENKASSNNGKTTDASTSVTASSGDVAMQSKLVDFYRMITSTTVVTGDANQYICTVRNAVKRTVTRFEVRINPSSETDFQFTPVANIDMLPEYLQCEIFCESKMAPVLMGDILQSLYDEEEEEEEEEENAK